MNDGTSVGVVGSSTTCPATGESRPPVPWVTGGQTSVWTAELAGSEGLAQPSSAAAAVGEILRVLTRADTLG